MLGGVVFDAATLLFPGTVMGYEGFSRGRELHYFVPESSDRILATIGQRVNTLTLFRRDIGSVSWREDSRRLESRRVDSKPDGEWDDAWWSVDVKSGKSDRLGGLQVARSVALGNLSVAQDGALNRLLKLGPKGEVARDYGPVRFERVLKIAGRSPDCADCLAILQVRYETHDGLAFIDAS